MKIYAPAALAALERGEAVTTYAAAILCDPPVRVWRGYGPQLILGDMFDGIGEAGIVESVGGSMGGGEQNITLTLSGVEPATLAAFDAASLRRAPCLVYELIFDGSATQLLDVQIIQRGTLDQIPVEDTPGGTATIKAVIETAARGLGRRGGRMRTDTDQRLVKATDGGFKAIAYAGQKNLYWGGKRPAVAGSALGTQSAAHGLVLPSF